MRDSVSIEIVWPSGSTPTRQVGHVGGVVPSLKCPALNTRSHLSHVTNVSLWRPATVVTTIQSGGPGAEHAGASEAVYAAPGSIPDRRARHADYILRHSECVDPEACARRSRPDIHIQHILRHSQMFRLTEESFSCPPRCASLPGTTPYSTS